MQCGGASDRQFVYKILSIHAVYLKAFDKDSLKFKIFTKIEAAVHC